MVCSVLCVAGFVLGEGFRVSHVLLCWIGEGQIRNVHKVKD